MAVQVVGEAMRTAPQIHMVVSADQAVALKVDLAVSVVLAATPRPMSRASPSLARAAPEVRAILARVAPVVLVDTG